MLHTTADGLITAPYPDEEGWSREETCGAVTGPTVATVLKCKRTVPDEFLFFLAKDYGIPQEHVVDAETLVREVFAGSYQKMFPQVRYDRVSHVQVGGVDWVEAAMQMTHPRLGALAKLERVCTVGERVLLVSIEGTQAVVAKHWAGSATAWMSGVRFARLTAASPPATPAA